MKSIHGLLWLVVVTMPTSFALAQKQTAPQALQLNDARVETYKTIGDAELKITIFEPEGHQASEGVRP